MMKLTNWLTKSDEKQAEEPVEVGGIELDADSEVLESGHDLSDFKEDIEEREDQISQLQKDIDRHNKKKKRAAKRAKLADNENKQRKHLADAKEEKELKEKKEGIVDHLQEEKLRLKQLMLQHMQQAIQSGDSQNISLSDIPINDVESAIESAADDTWESRENMQDLDDAMEIADDELGGLNLEDVREETDSEEDPTDLSNRSLETEEEIDQAIEDLLDEMGEEA